MNGQESTTGQMDEKNDRRTKERIKDERKDIRTK